ncbi:hypothetical protein JCM5353_007216 [Sporobolomyces roseus]
MRSLTAFAASLLLVATPSLAFSLPADDSSSIFTTPNPSSGPSTSSYHFDERSGILTDFSPSSSLTRRDTITATYGLMLERDVASDPTRNKFQKRKFGDEEKRARDIGSEVVEVEFSKRGDVILPGSVLEKRAKKKQNRRRPSKKSKSKKSKKSEGSKGKKAKKVKVNKVVKSSPGNLQSSSTNGVQRSLVKIAASIPKIFATITWYTGADLNLPSCADKSGWTPTDNSLISAVTINWGDGKPACGTFLQLKTPSNNKSVIVRVVDSCQGCKKAHVDLSIAAFKALFSLDVGKADKIEVSTLSGPPFEEWTPQLTKLYGPQVL